MCLILSSSGIKLSLKANVRGPVRRYPVVAKGDIWVELDEKFSERVVKVPREYPSSESREEGF